MQFQLKKKAEDRPKVIALHFCYQCHQRILDHQLIFPVGRHIYCDPCFTEMCIETFGEE
ncbi:hypothetical protein [Sporosarcina sp. FSL W7-1283]|uniref:hypothetical protein n=1 Tax=Sporosarcina sp. FSL W7-1283 TaxID=2921560 RepID=UPI0030F6D6BC